MTVVERRGSLAWGGADTAWPVLGVLDCTRPNYTIHYPTTQYHTMPYPTTEDENASILIDHLFSVSQVNMRNCMF